MKSPSWWKSAVVYQIYPRSFQDSNGDGVGDIHGITSRLDELKALGVDVLWLSPVQTSPMVDFGYDISDYRGIDPLFGTMEDFDRLLSEAHARGLKVVLDIVINHSSDQHPWFVESRSSRTNPKRDWYFWREGAKPNNWLGVFGGSAWEWDKGTRSWYLHSFLKQQPDLNWRNPEVKKAVLADLEFWLKRGIDGFRFDVFNLWFKHPELKSNPPRFWGWRYFRPYNGQKHLYDGFHEDIHAFLKELRVLLDNHDALSVGESYFPDGWSAEGSASYLGNGDELHLTFEFSGLDDPWSARATLKTMSRWMEVTNEPNWPALVYSNHDVIRARTRLSRGRPAEAEDRARIMAALLLLWRGTPVLYYGEEIGMPQVRLKRSQIKDPVGLRYWPIHTGRDGARTPMAWDSTPGAGFSKVEPWLPFHPDHEVRNVAVQRADPGSLWNWYAGLLRLRRDHEVFQAGSWEAVDVGHPDVLAFRRFTDAESWLVMANFSSHGAEARVPQPARWVWGSRSRETIADRLLLEPNEVIVSEEIHN